MEIKRLKKEKEGEVEKKRGGLSDKSLKSSSENQKTLSLFKEKWKKEEILP